MAQLPEQLTPASGDRGLALADPDSVGVATLNAWNLLIEAARSCDLTLPSRTRDRTGAQMLLPFGDYPENRGMAQILDDARNGRTGTVDQLDDAARVLEAHGQDSPDEIVAALERSRDDLESWIDDGGPRAEGMLLTRSLLGTLPVLTLVHAMSFQLAVTARDLEPCGATVPAELLDTGLLALLDTTGALAARQNATASLTVTTPELFVGTGAQATDWCTVNLDEFRGLDIPLGPGIIASSAVMLDIASGKANVPGLYASGDVKVTDLSGLLALAPIIEGVPGIPGGAALAKAAKLMSGLGGLMGALSGKR